MQGTNIICTGVDNNPEGGARDERSLALQKRKGGKGRFRGRICLKEQEMMARKKTGGKSRRQRPPSEQTEKIFLYEGGGPTASERPRHLSV